MIPNGTSYAQFPSFANNGTKTPPGGSPESAKYALGMVPADTFPAEWANYLFHGATAGITRLNQDTNSIKKELNTILSEYGITNDASAYDQLVGALAKIFPQVCTCSTAAATAAKSVALTGYTRKVGAIFVIEMTNGNTVANPTLTINSVAESTAPICDANGAALGSGAWGDGDTITVLYTGSKYIMATGAVANKIENSNMSPVTSNAVSCLMAASTTITNAPVLGLGGNVKILFTNNIAGSNTTTPLSISYNGTAYPVKVSKAGTLENIYAHEISSGTYRYIQANTVIEVVKDSNGNFVIVGNPILLSGTEYTIYADGSNIYDINALDYSKTTLIITPSIGTTKTDVYTATARCHIQIEVSTPGSPTSTISRAAIVLINDVEQARNGLNAANAGLWVVGSWDLRKGDVVAMQRVSDASNIYKIYITPFVS